MYFSLMAGNMTRLIYFFPTYFSMLKGFKTQRVFLEHELEPLIQKAIQTNDGSLDHEDISKIREYYGFGVPAIVGEGFCTLRGQAMTATERQASTFQGAITGLFDDFFDKTRMSLEQIREMMQRPQNFKPGSSLEELFIAFLLKVHNNSPDRDKLNQAFDEVFKVQVKSLSQEENDLHSTELREITFAKGGYSLLFYRSVFKNSLVKGEEEAIFQVGALMQLANDLFDVYEDSRQGIKTLITIAKHIDELRAIYQAQLNKAIEAVRRLDYPEARIRIYLHKLSLGISRCMVCFEQLEQLEKNNNAVFDPMQFNREQLIWRSGATGSGPLLSTLKQNFNDL